MELDPCASPLASVWTWYAHSAASKYSDSLVTLGRMTTIREFWCHYNHIPTASIFTHSEIRVHGAAIHGYAVFRDAVTPEWEHAVNVGGGEFLLRVYDAASLDIAWRDLLVACAGETQSGIVGVRCMRKQPFPKIEVWHATGEDEAVRAFLHAQIARRAVRIVSHKTHAATLTQA